MTTPAGPPEPGWIHPTLDAAYEFTQDHGRLPTVKELAARMGLPYPTVYARMRAITDLLELPKGAPGRPRKPVVDTAPGSCATVNP